ncbi:DUF1481 domain-containing protein [Salmonella enterica subsp. enterica]|nr:DUF1481 domain-containing protein [Salmonella enterica subsp. enterica]
MLTLPAVITLHRLRLLPAAFAGDHDAVRIWRKDTNDEVHLLSVFSVLKAAAARRPANIVGRVMRLNIELNIYSKPPEHIRARFDAHGEELSFMQREVGAETAAFNDQIALQPSLSRRTNPSDRVTPCAPGGVIPRRGDAGTPTIPVTTCEKVKRREKPDLDLRAISHIERRQNTHR